MAPCRRASSRACRRAPSRPADRVAANRRHCQCSSNRSTSRRSLPLARHLHRVSRARTSSSAVHTAAGIRGRPGAEPRSLGAVVPFTDIVPGSYTFATAVRAAGLDQRRDDQADPGRHVTRSADLHACRSRAPPTSPGGRSPPTAPRRSFKKRTSLCVGACAARDCLSPGDLGATPAGGTDDVLMETTTEPRRTSSQDRPRRGLLREGRARPATAPRCSEPYPFNHVIGARARRSRARWRRSPARCRSPSTPSGTTTTCDGSTRRADTRGHDGMTA